MQIKNICVIGAGVSGLVTAKTFLEEGYDVTVFEKKPDLGGVWEKSCSYPEVTLQNTRDTYRFSDYPMPESYPEWPTGEQVRNYLYSYAQDFGVIGKIKFQTEVIDVAKNPGVNSGWLVSIKEKDANSNDTKIKTYEFDFVVVCNGQFSYPNIPSLPGVEEFMASGGQVLHSTQCNDISIIKGKRVVVLGGGKSACDLATLAAKTAKECTLVYREPKWIVPRFFFGFINLKYILLTRSAEAWLPYRQMMGFEKILHSFGKPLVWLFWRTIEMVLRLQLKLNSRGFLPSKQLNQIDCELVVAPEGFFQYIDSGKIQTKKTIISNFTPHGVSLANGEQLEADLVILGTGFQLELPFLEGKSRQLIIDGEENFHLYRYLIPPNVPQMGFVGYNVNFFTLLTLELSAWWLVEYIRGNLSLPSPIEMEQEITAELEAMKANLGFIPNQGTCLNSFSLRYIYQLLKDISGNNQLVVWENFNQMMKPVDLSVYSKVIQKIKQEKGKKNSNSGIQEQVAVN